MSVAKNLRWIILGVLLVFLVLIALSLVSLRERIENLDLGQQTGPVWFMTGIEFELLQLENSILAYSLGDASAGDVNQRFDILWSRLATSMEGENAQKLRNYGVDFNILAELFQGLKAVDSAIVSLPSYVGDETDVMPILSRLNDFNAPLRRLSLEVLRTSSNQALGWRVDLVFASRQIGFLIGFTVASFLIILAILLLENLSARGSLKEKDVLLAEAEAANLAKSQFISVMNHELRTPLTSIHGALRMMASGVVGEFTEKQSKLLDMAERNSEHLSLLIEDVLDFQRFSDGRIQMNPTICNVSDLIANDRPSYAAICSAHDVTFLFDTDVKDAVCDVDNKRLQQVLLNLIANAAKFSTTGGQVTMKLSRANKAIRIAVSDDGIGIPAEHHKKLFDPFYQVDSSDKRNKGGTGLGLSISKSIIESFGGRIWFDSALKKGTTFFVSLPDAAAV